MYLFIIENLDLLKQAVDLVNNLLGYFVSGR